MNTPATSTEKVQKKQDLKILIARPRGFCAGVERAIEIVELALKKYGPPVYVRHEIVHNKFVVRALEAKGAIFVEELDEIPDTDAPVIFSAHGVPRSVPAAAEARNMIAIDATCPLVTKVHHEARHQHDAGRHILMIGHAGHPEVIGTMGQLPDGAMTLVETVQDVSSLQPNDPDRLAYVTQTTLSSDDTRDIIAELRRRFPNISAPPKSDICYATTNRQEAVKRIAPLADHVIVVGAPNSSNSLRLVEVAKKAGCPGATLVQNTDDIPWPDIQKSATVGLTAGASAPEVLVTDVIDALRQRFNISLEEITVAEENIAFNVPRMLREATTPQP